MSDGDRRIVEDQRQIGELVESKGTVLAAHPDPTVAHDGQAIVGFGLDTRLGAETLQRNLTGGPPTPQTYTPTKAQEHREQSDRAAAQREVITASTIGVVGKLTGLDLAGIAAIITALGGTILSLKRNATSRQEADDADKEADIAVRSTDIALKAVPEDLKEKVLDSMKLLQEATGVRNRIRMRLKSRS